MQGENVPCLELVQMSFSKFCIRASFTVPTAKKSPDFDKYNFNAVTIQITTEINDLDEAICFIISSKGFNKLSKFSITIHWFVVRLFNSPNLVAYRGSALFCSCNLCST